ncbi:MAG: hypothetical protein EOO54_30310, partial [Haliea sp.]
MRHPIRKPVKTTRWMGAIVLLVAAAAQAQTAAPAAAPPAGVAGDSAAAPQAGFVKLLQGDVQLRGEGGVTRSARAGDKLQPADRIVTGPASGASLVLRDGTTMVVGPATRLDLKAFNFNSTTQD